MARSLARPPARLAAVALAAFCELAPAPRPPPRTKHVSSAALASHGAGRAGWGGAPVAVYDELERAGLPAADAIHVGRAILEESLAAAIEPRVVLAVIRVESNFDPRAVSPAGAVGLMQLMPFTLREVALRSGLGGGDPFDPVKNVRAGVRYLTALVGAFGDLELALMAYNAGPARIRMHLRGGGVPARLHRYPRDVLRLARGEGGARIAGASRPAVRPVASHARPAAQATLAAVTVLAGPSGAVVARVPPRPGDEALPRRRGLLGPTVLLRAA